MVYLSYSAFFFITGVVCGLLGKHKAHALNRGGLPMVYMKIIKHTLLSGVVYSLFGSHKAHFLATGEVYGLNRGGLLFTWKP